MALTIKELSNTVVRGGKLVNDVTFIIANEDGSLYGTKAYATEAEAKDVLAGLANFELGLEFVNATQPSINEKAKVGKAKAIAAYLAWVEAGKPVAAEAPAAEAPAETVEETIEAPAEEVEDDEEF